MFRVNSVSTFWRGVAVAVMSVLLASAARVVLLGHLGDRGIYITYFPAIAITGLIGGFWPAVLAAGMSVFATRLMSGNFVPPDPQRIETVRAVTAITFLASSLIIAAASGIMHRSRRREKAADEARRASVEALAESEARFSTMANASSVIIWLADADGKLTWVNNRWRELVGSDENEVGDAWAKYLHPDDADRITRAYQEAMAARRPFRLDYRVRRHDGEYRWLLDSGTPRLDADGRLIGYIGSAVDITDMKRATQRLRESEARLRLGLAAGEVGTWDWDFEKHRITWSDRLYEFHGLREGEFDGSVESYKNLIHPDDRGRVESAVRKALHEPDGAYRLEFRALRPDGSVRWLATTGSVMRDDAGRPLRMLGATIDVTERRKLEETQRRLLASERAARSDAERASNLKDEFLATLSHELRTPLSAILGWSQLLQSGRLSEKDHDEGLAVIERNARMQKQLIEDLLDVSRIITGKFRLEVQSVQLIDVASAALDTLRPSIEAKEIQLVTSFDSSLPLVRGDPARLQQVVWNLLTNAVKFTPRTSGSDESNDVTS
jgi:PAS domain S-box-containing protein